MFSPDELHFIQAQRVAHLATADAAGTPHVVPVCFACVDGLFWIPIDEKPKRTQRLKRLLNIQQNPNVALLFDRYDDDWNRLAYVLVHGTAAIVQGSQDHARALDELRRRYPQYRTMPLPERPAIRITPARAVAWGNLE